MNANGEWLPISKGGDLGLRKDGEPIHCTLGTDLLYNSNSGVAEDHTHKKKVLVGAYQQNSKSQQNVHKVKKSKDVIPENAANRFGFQRGFPVVKPLLHSLCHLRRGKTFSGRRKIPLYSGCRFLFYSSHVITSCGLRCEITGATHTGYKG